MGRALGGDVPMLPCTSVVTSPGRNSRVPPDVDGQPTIAKTLAKGDNNG